MARVVVLGAGLGGTIMAYELRDALGSDHRVSVVNKGTHFAAAVALEVLDIYEERDIVDRVRQLTPYFQSMLGAFSDHPLVGEARGAGLVGALELNRDKRTKAVFEPGQGVATYEGPAR